MMQLVEALNKAVANGDRESRFRGADELERYFNKTGLDEVQDGGVLEEERRILSMADRGDLANEGSKV